ncbi:polysaccharide deacetylase family protein [Methylobacterium aquaticum]|uniref:Chitooligosaccharide deacetylase n=1 Tax=Methylobacterium aquaticum TaxID=270351 RepID=A0A0J6VCG9_9HYPH|nr:polysaccharide deacetylase family protein [Methylobacterium aquaticum]KMO36756.1 chitin deacetylase [Methylobacterium aquaticum]
MRQDSAPDRDFRGYGGRPPRIAWPGGARLAVSVVVNVEEGAELSLGMGDERNESVYEVVEEVVGARDLCMESHFEYGTRAGWPRIRALLGAYGVAATLNANGRAVALSPWLAQEAVADGHEVAAHGWRWERHAGMGEAEERAAIARAVAAIRDATGTPPVGWHTRSATSVNTRRLLLEQGGFLYDSNAYNDDLPYLVPGREGRPHVVLPYAFDTNDMRFQRGGGFVFGDDFARYCIDAFDRLYAEGDDAPRMLSVGLHLRIIGRPGRIGGLERFLAHAAAHAGTWFARRDSIAAHWLRETAHDPEPWGR